MDFSRQTLPMYVGFVCFEVRDVVDCKQCRQLSFEDVGFGGGGASSCLGEAR